MNSDILIQKKKTRHNYLDGPWELGLRLTPADPEFKLRFQAFEPETDEDQRFVFVPRLSNVPEVLRLPASVMSNSRYYSWTNATRFCPMEYLIPTPHFLYFPKNERAMELILARSRKP